MKRQLDLQGLNLKSVGISELGSIQNFENPTPVELDDGQSIPQSSPMLSRNSPNPQKHHVLDHHISKNFKNSNSPISKNSLIKEEEEEERQPVSGIFGLSGLASPAQSNKDEEEQAVGVTEMTVRA